MSRQIRTNDPIDPLNPWVSDIDWICLTTWSRFCLRPFFWELDDNIHPKAIFTQKNELDVPKTWKQHTSISGCQTKTWLWLNWLTWLNINFLLVFKMTTPQPSHILFNYHINSIVVRSVHTKQRWIWQNGQWQHWNCEGFLQDPSVKSFVCGMPFRFSELCFLFTNMCRGVDSETLSRESQESTTLEMIVSENKCNRLLRFQWFQIQISELNQL